jgi:HNH endonuclease
MREGITCTGCNTTVKSMNQLQRVWDVYRCFTCSIRGELKAGRNGKVYLVPLGGKMPEDQPKKVSEKKVSVSQTKKVAPTSGSIDDKREEVISQIERLVESMGIKNIPGWENIPFKKINRLRDDKILSQEELVFLLRELEKIYKKGDYQGKEPGASNDTYHLSYKEEEEVVPEEAFEEGWRYQVPDYVKMFIEDWETLSSEQMRDEVEHLLIGTNVVALQNELEDFLGILEDLELEEENDEIDLLEVIEKYKDGRITTPDIPVEKDESWRQMVPTLLKRRLRDWQTADIHVVYDHAKGLLHTNRSEMMPFVVEMSQVIFDMSAQEEDEAEKALELDEIGDTIMSLVEMIILPHLEVLDLIQQRGGQITFSDLWHKPFTDQLKKEVKDRDEWRCVICEGETDLHVHHKIPRNKGGIHHPANLVTLCASCHGAVETADVKKAFQKCLMNYKKNKYNQLKPQNLTMDKKMLQEEVENSLDHLLFQLNKREEHNLMDEVIGVMKRLEVLFYG